MKFQIAAGDPRALAVWSVQSSYTGFIADWETVRPYLHATRAVNGDYTPYGALCELLEGTGLSFQYPWGGGVLPEQKYYIGIENSGPIPAYSEVCPTFTSDTPPSVHAPQADWR